MKKLNLITILLVVLIVFMGCKNNEILPSVTIGTQTWTNRNLDVTTYRNGDVIPQVEDITWVGLTTGAWCYYENLIDNDRIYGKLYNWYAVNDPRGLAPEGYHIPTDKEWTILTDYLGGLNSAGGKMKETCTSNWIYPNADANNSTGFLGLPGGCRDYNGMFCAIGREGNWWSSSEYAKSNYTAWFRELNYNSGSAYDKTHFNQVGFSVRCVKD